MYKYRQESLQNVSEAQTKKSVGDVFGNLVAGLARLGEMAQFFVQHPFELNTSEHHDQLQKKHEKMNIPQ